jgi:hypothetical protein
MSGNVTEAEIRAARGTHTLPQCPKSGILFSFRSPRRENTAELRIFAPVNSLRKKQKPDKL